MLTSLMLKAQQPITIEMELCQKLMSQLNEKFAYADFRLLQSLQLIQECKKYQS